MAAATAPTLTNTTPKWGMDTSMIAARMASATQVNAGVSSAMSLRMRKRACETHRCRQHARIENAEAILSLVQDPELHLAVHDGLRGVACQLKAIVRVVFLPDVHRDRAIGGRRADRGHRDFDLPVLIPRVGENDPASHPERARKILDFILRGVDDPAATGQ